MANRIHFLNTIWSDCILLESNNHYALIDSGSDFYYPMIKAYLNKLNIKELDFLILTHFHNDHYGCILKLLDDFKFKTTYLRAYSGHDGTNGNGTFANDEYRKGEMKTYLEIENKCKKLSKFVPIDDNFDHLDFYDFHFDILSTKENTIRIFNDINGPLYHINKLSENYESIAMFCMLEGVAIYLAADITDCENPTLPSIDRLNKKAVEEIYKKYNIDKVNIYKVAHHGVHDSNHEDTLALLKPDYAIVTNTDRWLKNYKTIDSLIKANKDIQIYRTDWQKYIFTIEKGKITIDAKAENTLFYE